MLYLKTKNRKGIIIPTLAILVQNILLSGLTTTMYPETIRIGIAKSCHSQTVGIDVLYPVAISQDVVSQSISEDGDAKRKSIAVAVAIRSEERKVVPIIITLRLLRHVKSTAAIKTVRKAQIARENFMSETNTVSNPASPARTAMDRVFISGE